MSCLTEYNEAETMELFKEEYLRRGREEGREEGRVEGREEGRVEGREEAEVNLIKGMLVNKTPKEISEFCGIPIELVEKVQKEMSE